MEKIDTATPDLTMENEVKLLDLFPQVATEVIGKDGGFRAPSTSTRCASF